MLASSLNNGEREGAQQESKHSPWLTLRELSFAWTLAARAEAKSENTIRAILSALSYFEEFLIALGAPTEAAAVTRPLIRTYIIYLQQKPAFNHHPYSHTQPRPLSDQSVHGYCRALRAFFNWLAAEDFISVSPFDHLKLPRMRQKVIAPYSSDDLKRLLAAVDTATPEGYRDLCMLLVMVDTAVRSGELTGMKLADVDLAAGCIKVLGKGNKERLVPIGSEVKRVLWRYVNCFRQSPANHFDDFLFLTREGRRLTRNQLLFVVKKYSRRAGIQGIRCSPHTLRHSAALAFLQNDGDAFALQKLLGHTSLEMTRKYCLLADGDLKKMHVKASPVDNLHFRPQAARRATARSY